MSEVPKSLIEEPENLPTVKERRQRIRRVGALVGMVIATAVGGDAERQSSFSSQEVAEHARDITEDPSFRATTLSFVESGHVFGSGSLAKSKGRYELVTVEHVVQGIYDLPTIAGKEVISVGISFGEERKKSYSAVIPGTGSFDLSKKGPKPRLIGPDKPVDDYDILDRFASLDLNDSLQTTIAKVEKGGQLKVPEIAQFKPKFGEQYWMPLEETGKRIPFVYVDRDVDGSARLIPLVLIDRNLNYQAGMKELRQQLSAEIGIEAKYLSNLPEEILAFNSHILASKLAAGMDLKDISRANSLAEWLPCRGDSGSPLLDREGRVVGVLSNVQRLENKSTRFGVVSRRGDLDPNRICGREASFSLPSNSTLED